MKLAIVVATAALAFAAASASAQTMKPGLWEMTNKMTSSSGEMEKAMAQAQQAMANMPPEQRKKMEEMMAKQGVGMGAGGSVKVCMSKEMVERNDMPVQQQGDCKSSITSKSGNTTKMAYTCTNPPSSGEGEYTLVSPEAYTSRFVTTTQVQGKPEKMTMNASGKWLSADCGAIKPMAVPKK